MSVFGSHGSQCLFFQFRTTTVGGLLMHWPGVLSCFSIVRMPQCMLQGALWDAAILTAGNAGLSRGVADFPANSSVCLTAGPLHMLYLVL